MVVAKNEGVMLCYHSDTYANLVIFSPYFFWSGEAA